MPSLTYTNMDTTLVKYRKRTVSPESASSTSLTFPQKNVHSRPNISTRSDFIHFNPRFRRCLALEPFTSNHLSFLLGSSTVIVVPNNLYAWQQVSCSPQVLSVDGDNIGVTLQNVPCERKLR
eukprot:1184290-Prorocentrum_minimum.AAC.1